MTTVVYRGEPTNLGRFGPVMTGQTLVLTPREVADVGNDPRFDFRAGNKKAISADDEVKLTVLELEQMSKSQLIELAKSLAERKLCDSPRRGANAPQLRQLIMSAGWPDVH